MNCAFLNNAILEILLHIGTSFELKKTVNDALLSYLQQLDLAGALLFEEVDGSFILHTAKPKIFKSNDAVSDILNLVIMDEKRIKEQFFEKSLPFVIEKQAHFYYLFALEGFGLMLFIKNENPLDIKVQKALKLINTKFSNSLIACKNIEKLRERDKQLLQQSRLAQMGEMISMIAHQWRQPLGTISSTIINMQLKFMMGKFELETKEGIDACQLFIEEKLKNIESYVQSLSTTIDDFRNFYNPNKKKKVLPIKNPLQKSMNIIKTSMKSDGIMIEESYRSNKEILMADSELMQVFLNIFKNAQDNFREKDIADATIMIQTRDTKEGIMVEISDNGGGIPKKIIEKVFNPYFSTKNEKNGTGLGLYMSKTIIEEHHRGKLTVQNRDKGVCFTIKLKT